jgi:hypothetical protein
LAKISEHEFDHNLKGRAKNQHMSNMMAISGYTLLDIPPSPFKPLVDCKKKARKEKFLPYLRGNCLGMYGTYRKYKLQGCCS